jgi:hypothetical protein
MALKIQKNQKKKGEVGDFVTWCIFMRNRDIKAYGGYSGNRGNKAST